MNQTRTPLVLIIDDDVEYREKLLPTELQRLGARVAKAADVDGALRLIMSTHGPSANDSLDLIILDMHMPLNDAPGPIDEEAGVKILNKMFSLHEYRLVKCPVIVFTAYASFRNCVCAIKAGAADYIAKQEREDPIEGGLDDLLTKCKNLLFGSDVSKSEAIPGSEWLHLHGQWLRDTFEGKWVAFVGEKEGNAVGLRDRQKYPVVDGIVIIPGSTYDEVRSLVFHYPSLVEQLPIIVQVVPA